MMRRFRLVPRAVVAAGAVAWSACGNGADLGIGGVLVVASVEVTPGSVTLIQNQTLPFVASPRTSSGVPVLGRAVAWSSADPGIASVASDGTVSAVAPGTTRITALVDGVSGISEVTVSNVPVDRIDLLPEATAVVIGSTVQLTANVYDADGGVLTGRLLTWSSSDVLRATVSATGLVTTYGVGEVTITATVEGKSGASTITVSPRPPSRLGFLTPPADAVAGAAFAPAVQVAIQDATGATVSSATNSVTLALAGGAAGATLLGTVSVSAVNGVATFPDLSVTKAGTGYTLAATAASFADVTSAPFAVRAAAGSQLGITTQPGGGASAAPLNPQPAVQILDQFGNPAAQAGLGISASLASGTGTLAGGSATTSANGAATFNTLAITGAPGVYTLSFGAPGLTPVTSAPIALTAGSANNGLVFTAAPPATATNGQPFSGTVTVALRDAGGAPVPQAGVAITASVASGAGVLSGPLTATTDAAGTASFAGLVLTGQAGPYTLTFSGAGINPLTSAPIQLAAGSATKLVLAVAPPATAVSGMPLVPAPAVQLADASGNPVATAGVQVTAKLATGTGTLTGATATTSSTGLATFSSLAIGGPAGSYSLAFEAAPLTGVTTGTITLTAGAPAQLTFTVSPPATAVNGQTLNPQPVLQLRDADGVPVPLAGVQVTASAAGPTLAGSVATTNADGVATFTGLVMSGVAGNYSLVFTAAGVANTASSPIALTAGPATQLTFTTSPPVTAANGQPFSAAPALQLRDAGGNAVAESGVTVTVAIASGPAGTLSGTLSVATSASGLATFPNLAITGPLGDYTLTFTAAGLSAATSGTVTLVAGPPAGIALTTQPSASAKNDEAFQAQPVVTVTDATGNPASGVLVTASIASAPPPTDPPTSTPVLGGTVSATTNASGVATFTSLEIVGPIGDYSLQFAAGAVSVTSGTLTLLVGVETRVVVTVQPTKVRLLAAIFPAPRVELRDSGNNLVPVDGRTVTVSKASGNGLFWPFSTLMEQTSGGVAVFNNIQFLSGSGNHRLRFSSEGLTAAVSVTFKVD
jgi:hypothetical protein